MQRCTFLQPLLPSPSRPVWGDDLAGQRTALCCSPKTQRISMWKRLLGPFRTSGEVPDKNVQASSFIFLLQRKWVFKKKYCWHCFIFRFPQAREGTPVQVHLLQPHEPGREEHHPYEEDSQCFPHLRAPRPHEDPGRHQLWLCQVQQRGFNPRH